MFSKIKTLTGILAGVIFLCIACSPRELTKYRILSAGIAHESNTFIPYLAQALPFVASLPR